MNYKTFMQALSLLVVCFTLFVSVAIAGPQIRRIDIEGAGRIEPSTILSYLDLKVGDEMTQESMDDALKSLFATGLFADIVLEQNNTTLIVKVAENPIINQIAFEGNDSLEDGELLAEIALRPRQVFTRTRVQSDVARLFQIYRRNGRFSAEITPKVIKLDQNRVDLVFEIDEGDITVVESIRFVGNKRYDDSRLRSEISTKETAWYKLLSSDDRYDPDRLSYDQELLRKFYLSQGYADFRVISANAELSNDQSSFFITLTVEEGQRYKFGTINLDSQLRDFDVTPLERYLNSEDEEWYNADWVQKTAGTLIDALGDLQYAFVDVRPDIDRLRDEALVNVTFVIQESPRAFVERIDVNGNVRTLDKVIRRELMLVEGDPFNKSKLARSEQNIKNLDYFEGVEIDVLPGSAPDKTIVDIDVAEKSTGELSIGAGFSTNDGPLADFRIRERNFLGKGQDVLASAVIAGERTEFDFSFTEPYFLDRDLSAGFDVFHITRDLQDESSFDQRRTGGALRVGYPWSEKWRQSVRYRYERNDITDVQNDASRFIQDQEGQRDTSALSQRLTYDDRDSKVLPTSGWFYWLDTEIAGLGGDAKYLSGKTGATYYYPVADQWILNFLGETGAISAYGDTDVKINERFFLGGSTLRGFEQAGVGPRDTVADDSLGGNIFYRGSAELSFPIGLPNEFGILAHTFSDFGTLWEVDSSGPEIVDESTVRVSAGVGLSWKSPFGPVRVDFAAPISKESFDQEEAFRFNFGTRF